MDLLGRLIRGAETRAGSSTLANPADWLINAFGGAATNSGERVTIKNSLGLIAVFAAVNGISSTVGMLPLKVYRMASDVKTEAPSHRAWRMLHDKPNPLMTANKFWQTLTADVLLWGNGFAELERTDGVTVDTMWPLDPARVTIEWNEELKVKRFRYAMPTGGERILSDDQVLHLLDMSLDGVVGLSRIATCREGIGKALARDRFEGSFHQRGGTVRGVVEYPGRLRNHRPLRESWNEVYGGSANANQVAILEEGATFKNVQMPLADMQFVESAKLSHTEIAVLFGLPPARIGGSTGDSLTYATVEGNELQYATQTIAPITTNFQAAVSADPAIFPLPAWWAEFELKGMMRGDSKSRSEFYEKLVGVEALHWSEVRDLESLGPWPDEYDHPDDVEEPVVPAPIGEVSGNGRPDPGAVATG